MFGHSFPQPEDVDEETEADSDSDPHRETEDSQPTEIAPVDTEQEARPTFDNDIPHVLGIVDHGHSRKAKLIPAPSDIGLGNTRNQEANSPTATSSKRNISISPGQETFVTATDGVSTSDAQEARIGANTSESFRDEGEAEAEGSRGSNELENRASSSLAQRTSRSSVDANGTASLVHGTTNSTASLLTHHADNKSKISGRRSLRHHDPRPVEDSTSQQRVMEPKLTHTSTGVRFNVSENVTHKKERIHRNLSDKYHRASTKTKRRNTLRDGAIVKMEKMLVKADTTAQQLEEDFDENTAQKIDTKAVEKWREYMVVVRKNGEDDADFRLQMYKSRVIPEIESGNVKKKCTHEVKLDPSNTNVNLYSSLDKTVCVWHPYKKGTRIYVIRPRATAHSVEWYTFLRDALGWSRPSTLQVHVPDLSMSLELKNPFEELESSRSKIESTSSEDAAYVRTIAEEQAVAGKVIQKCVKMLEGDPEWTAVLEHWSKTEKMGLAWKRYDRLEWVHGVNEQKMYGSMAMQRSHELELRPKQHYPTSTVGKKGKLHEEPEPIEGFLIRLTSQKGLHQRLGKMLFKRLYFTTQNQYLVFCRPANASPPHPPRLQTISGTNVPSAGEIIDKTPMMFDVNPFPLDNGEIQWLKSGNKEHVSRHDQRAQEESLRNVQNLSDCDGYINLCRVLKVRKFHWGATDIDEEVDEGSDVDYHEEVDDQSREDGRTGTVDDDRTFELVLNNGLVVRLQAYNEETKNEWIRRLRKLVKYWTLRTSADMELFKATRQSNLDHLNIDEEMEAMIGQFAKKWEVSKSEASPQLYHLCGISCCRTLSISGQLYHKPRRHGSFSRCHVILTNGKMLIFQGSLRKRSGKEIPHIHQERQTSLDLRDCYLYSGLLTEGDLLYQNQTFDSNHPGMHALHRVYLEDGWTSSDEDAMTCFVLWHGLRKSFFRAHENKEGGGTRQKLRQVSRLGAPGRSVVFKCRSRAERDHWVMSIGMEIDRLQQGEDVRVEATK